MPECSYHGRHCQTAGALPQTVQSCQQRTFRQSVYTFGPNTKEMQRHMSALWVMLRTADQAGLVRTRCSRGGRKQGYTSLSSIWGQRQRPIVPCCGLHLHGVMHCPTGHQQLQFQLFSAPVESSVDVFCVPGNKSASVEAFGEWPGCRWPDCAGVGIRCRGGCFGVGVGIRVDVSGNGSSWDEELGSIPQGCEGELRHPRIGTWSRRWAGSVSQKLRQSLAPCMDMVQEDKSSQVRGSRD